MSLRDKILAADDIPSELVRIPEWDVDLLVRGMTARDRIRLMQTAVDPNTGQINMSIVYPDVVVACVLDPATKQPVFTEDDKESVLGKASAAIETIAAVGLRLSGIGKDEQDAMGKDSSASPSDDSSSN